MRLFVILMVGMLSSNLYSMGWHGFITPTYKEPVKKIVFAEKREPTSRNIFMFDPNHLQWAVYDKKGKRVGIGKGVGGKDYCPDVKEACRTVEGTFTVFHTENEECTSKTFPIDEGGGAPMPHCMFFL